MKTRHGKEKGKAFSCKGIKLVVEYFLKRGHTQIKALVPRFRRGNSDHDCPTLNPEILDHLEEKGYLTYTPSRYVNNKLILPYDDRFILKAAHYYNGIIVSNDNYRDLMKESQEWKRVIETNLLQYSFIGDLFMIADDPMGRCGPNLNQFLSINSACGKNNFNLNKNNNMKKNQSSSRVTPSGSTQATYDFNYEQVSTSFQPKSNLNELNSLTNSTIGISKFTANSAESNHDSEMYSKLIDIFPKSDIIIRELLKSYYNEKDINFFISRLLDSSHI